jgi:hypothetical protein
MRVKKESLQDLSDDASAERVSVTYFLRMQEADFFAPHFHMLLDTGVETREGNKRGMQQQGASRIFFFSDAS